jgi:hypothetical protein
LFTFRLFVGQRYRTSISDDPEGRWNEGFEFDVTFHDQLFGICQVNYIDTFKMILRPIPFQLDLYASRILQPDLHLGRAEIILPHLPNMPDQFTT